MHDAIFEENEDIRKVMMGIWFAWSKPDIHHSFTNITSRVLTSISHHVDEYSTQCRKRSIIIWSECDPKNTRELLLFQNYKMIEDHNPKIDGVDKNHKWIRFQ